MMKMRSLCGVILGTTVALSAVAEPIRPSYTKENKFPEVGAVEVGAAVTFTELGDNNEMVRMNDANLWTVGPYARYMMSEDLAVDVGVEAGGINPDMGGSENGMGDVSVGLTLRAYEDLFRFPYILPHVTLNLDTADDDVGIGAGESSVKLGTTLGSTVYDTVWHFNMDVSYELFEDSDNVFAFGASAIWDISEKFSLLAEAQITDAEPEDIVEEHPARFGGAMLYEPNDRTTLGLYGAGVKNSREDVITTIRVSYDL